MDTQPKPEDMIDGWVVEYIPPRKYLDIDGAKPSRGDVFDCEAAVAELLYTEEPEAAACHAAALQLGKERWGLLSRMLDGETPSSRVVAQAKQAKILDIEGSLSVQPGAQWAAEKLPEGLTEAQVILLSSFPEITVAVPIAPRDPSEAARELVELGKALFACWIAVVTIPLTEVDATGMLAAGLGRVDAEMEEAAGNELRKLRIPPGKADVDGS